MREIRRILVPIDFSGHATRAFEDAIELAKIWGAELHLLHCYPIHPEEIELYGPDVPETLDRDLREVVLRRLDEWCDKARAAGVAVQRHITARRPGDGIAALGEELDVDLIVMGTRGLRGLDHVLLGSVAERTLRLASCPVWVVRDTRSD